ncbi:16S rRNA (guanine(966)-N(2))-methyltransferase RsmD [Mycoplasma elephantis]|uniref:16S rRNA (guanine(966)-N(2))-methyltransferase RsmD n=1 Tax=Mycoplasma elephantis TaxID=114882 RepID=UPI0004889816|nr:16S rRNA (guanine(966)-N(2))-methyltransferase RsmD [Mycoplasma elephantis]
MIRIISGKYRHRIIKQPLLTQARPTQDKIKEAVFNSLRFKENKKTFLDLFSGSGSIGIEAISNDFKLVDFVEIDKNNIKIIEDNLKKLEIQNFRIFNENAINFTQNNNFKYDVIYLDPPYNDIKLLNLVLFNIKDQNILNNDGIIIIETRYPNNINIDNFSCFKTKKYGQNFIMFLTK